MARLPTGVGKALGAATPKKVGGSLTGHVWSRNARKGNYSHMEGVRAPKAGGLSSKTAPMKHEIGFFNAGFGRTGMDGEN